SSCDLCPFVTTLAVPGSSPAAVGTGSRAASVPDHSTFSQSAASAALCRVLAGTSDPGTVVRHHGAALRTGRIALLGAARRPRSGTAPAPHPAGAAGQYYPFRHARHHSGCVKTCASAEHVTSLYSPRSALSTTASATPALPRLGSHRRSFAATPGA